MNYPEAEPSRYQMEFLFSSPEGRGIKPLPSRPPKRNVKEESNLTGLFSVIKRFSSFTYGHSLLPKTMHYTYFDLDYNLFDFIIHYINR